MDQPGIEIRPIVNIAGGHEFNEVFFTDARTPADHVVGAVNEGWQVANQLLAFERGDDATVVALRLGGVEERLLDVARRRGRLGDPPVRQALARIHSEVEILRFLGLRTAHQAAGRRGARRRELDQQAAVDRAAPAHDRAGGRPLRRAQPVPRRAMRRSRRCSSRRRATRRRPRPSYEHFLGARPASIYSGSNEIQRNIVGERILGLPKEPRADEGPWN